MQAGAEVIDLLRQLTHLVQQQMPAPLPEPKKKTLREHLNEDFKTAFYKKWKL
jgi:hypothetical protein